VANLRRPTLVCPQPSLTNLIEETSSLSPVNAFSVSMYVRGL
jgi:hypothetical protein